MRCPECRAKMGGSCARLDFDMTIKMTTTMEDLAAPIVKVCEANISLCDRCAEKLVGMVTKWEQGSEQGCE